MSSKWRALQHRHKYTYSAVIFPKSYTDSLHQLPSHVLKLKFYHELEQIVSLTSIYAQVNRSKNLGLAFGELLGSSCEDDDEGLVAEATRFYLEILFFENSLQLHRTLVSSLAKARKFEHLISGCFRKLCEEYGGGADGGGKRFCVSRVALSMMGTPKLGYLVDVVEECAVLVAWDVVLGLNSVVLETSDSSRPSPIVMEQCQEALSCSYYLLQRFPSKFSALDGSRSGSIRGDSSVLEMLVTVILSVLKSSAFSRDCFVAAGVSFCAALQICLSPENLGVFIMEGIFHRATSSSIHGHRSDNEYPAFGVPYEGDLYSEINNFSELSRLCLIRGILTAVSRTVLNTQIVVSGEDLNGYDVHGKGGNYVETIFFDGILPELCNHCENPTDSHFNFHALTVLQICLQQIKTSMLANLVNLSEKYDPIPEDMGTRILKIIWNNLEDPLSQTVKQVILIFELFLDIQSNLHWGKGEDKIKSFLRKIASDLLCLGPRCKGRYAPLTSLTKRLGAKALLGMCPGLLTQTVQAYVDDDVCCAVTSFLKCFLENMRDECWSSYGIEEGYTNFRGHCLPPFLHGLASGFVKLRSNLSTYAVPVLLEVDVDSIYPMLAFISVGQRCEESELIDTRISSTPVTLTVDEKLAILISLLKVSRLLALIEGDIDYCDDSLLPGKRGTREREISNSNAIVCIKGIKHRVPVEWFVIALSHRDESLRVDAAELLFLNPKTSSLPSNLELSLIREAVPLNMRCCSTGFQMKWTSMFRKFFARVKTALERQVKQGIWQPLLQSNSNGGPLYKITDKTAKARSEALYHFMRWLSCFLFYSCYPSAPYERKIMAMDLFLIMIDIWSVIPLSGGNGSSLSPEDCLYLYNSGITLPDSTLLLVGSIVDSWDKLRENSFRILLHFPTPLPGISSQDTVQKVITWAKQLVESPRVRESDAGALTLRLIFRKYVLELKWIIRASAFAIRPKPEVVNENENFQTNISKFPVIEYINGLIDWLRAVVEEGEKDLYEACTTSFVHGVLLTLRYTFEELDWNSDIVLSCIPNMRSALEKLLELVLRITSLALGVVSADAWFSEDMDEMVGDEAFLLLGDSGSTQQVVMVGCWLAMKEVSLLLGTIVRKIPLPTNTSIDTSKSVNVSHDASEVATSQVMLDVNQLETIGNHFLEVLLKMKHNGAIDKTRAGFTALCNRLLCSNDPRLCKLTDAWMEQLMEKTVSKGQVVDDLLRRSAGIPAAFSALFLSEPEGTPKKLLPRALRWLIDVANRSLLDLSETNSMTDDSCSILPTKLSREAASLSQHEMNGSENTSKTRDEGVVPTVHAFNVLRAAFNDANLSTDTSGFSAEALIISIRSFSSPYWEIRNSACSAYTALVRRIIGFLNVQKRESARRALTGLEFFHRYPSLHLFLLNELKVATESLGDGSSGKSVSNLANVVHPSLYPILILLSRLKPSTITSEAGDPLDPFLFAPFIRRCSTQSNLKIRVLASRALSGLISNEKLTTVLLSISSELPSVDRVPFASNTIHGTLLQLCSLLDTNCRNLAEFSKKDHILAELIEVMSTRAWIGSPKLCRCPILSTSFLTVLNHMLSIVKSRRSSRAFIAIRSLLLKLSKECLHNEGASGSLLYDPTTAERRKQAVVSYFSCVFQVSKEVTEVVQMPLKFSHLASELSMVAAEKPETENEFVGFLQTLIPSLNDQSYEVRLATLKWLFQFLKSTEYGNEGDNETSSEVKLVQQWAKTDLQDTLMKLLAAEKHHKCTCYILKIFFVWNKLQSEKFETKSCTKTAYIGQMDYESVISFWDTLVSLYKVTRHAKTQEAIICCLGICMKCFVSIFADSITSALVSNHEASDQNVSDFRKLVAYYVDVIKRNSGAAEPVKMRIAAADSIVSSGLLQEAEFIGSLLSNVPNEAIETYAHALLDIWFTCFKLLEDEDMELRQQLALDLQKIMALSKSRRNPKPGVAPVQVEKVIELSFEYLSSIFGHWIEYFDYLLNWVFNVANVVFVSTGDLVRRVFDKEIDNHHEENILISQICCYQLEKLPILQSWMIADNTSRDKDAVLSHLKEWRTRFCRQLTSFADDHIKNFDGADWIGGVGNHKDSFLPLYANLLGIYVLSKCIFAVKLEPAREGSYKLLDEIADVGEKIYPFLRNPLISNLYVLVTKLHENAGDDRDDCSIPKSDGSSSSIWDGFDPYFLIR